MDKTAAEKRIAELSALLDKYTCKCINILIYMC